MFNVRSGHLVGGNKRTEVFREAEAPKIVKRTLPSPDKAGTVAIGHVQVDGTQFSYREVDWPETKEKRANIAANKWSADWKEDDLVGMLREIGDSSQWPSIGFSSREIDAMLREQEVNSNMPKILPAQATDALVRKWQVRPGDLWALGEHTLLCGDAMSPESWKRLGGPFRFCFADPPYELVINANSLRCACTCDCLMMLADSVVLGQDRSAFGGFFVYTYDNADFAQWTNIPMRQHTLIAWWHWSKMRRSFKGLGTHFHAGKSNHVSSTLHRQSKPEELGLWLLPFFSKKGDEFADAFSGSGMMIFAAEHLNRKARSVELSARYCAAILERWVAAGHSKPECVERGTGE